MYRPKSHRKTRWTVIAFLGAGVVTADALSKELVKSSTSVQKWRGIQLVDNPSWSAGAGGSHELLVPVLSALMLVAATVWLYRRGLTTRLPTPAIALLLGGGLANLLDRLAHGAVTDFIATPWLIVNLADIAVLTGLTWLATTVLPRRTTQMSRSGERIL